ncbi:hypothetical protein B9T16_26875 [Arthrospira sp. PCC 8006]
MVERVSSESVSACLEGEGCDQKLKPNCHGWDMPNCHGVDIDTAVSKSIMARTSLKTTCCI